MKYRVELMDARPRPPQGMRELFSEGFPEFITADQQAKAYVKRVQEYFAGLHLVLLDEQDCPVAAGWGVPVVWDGTPGDLPAGYTDSLLRAVTAYENGLRPDTLVVCGAVVTPALKGRGIAGQVLVALREHAVAEGLLRVVAPVRPTLKSRYPLAPVEEFMHWTRPDGLPLDPWLRTHRRAGARILAPAPSSQTMTGTVAQWEGWTGLALPASGEYVIPDGLSLLSVDRESDRGTYTEPNVWMQHL